MNTTQHDTPTNHPARGLNGRRALVTGGTRGIGRAIGVALAEAGARVLVCGSTEAGVARFGQLDTGIRATCCDLTEDAELRSLVAEVDTCLGGLDLLVNCAGIQQSLDLVDLAQDADLEREVAVNLVAPMRLTAMLLSRLLVSDGAAIVNVTSVMAIAPTQRAPVYSATKAGLASWTMALRYQLEAHGVLVMELVPPLVATQMTVGRQSGAIEPSVVAEACLDGLRRGRTQVCVGKAKTAHLLGRVAPQMIQRIVRNR